ncbi:ribonuclease P protein subunit p25-like protein [Rhinoraja longicauda]
MEDPSKGEEESPLPFHNLPLDVVEMRVKEGSKIRNLMGFAIGRMELQATSHMVFSGSGRAVTKTITCVEIMKRRIGGLYQVTRLRYKPLREDVHPPGAGEDVPPLTLLRNVPAIYILLSKEPLDPTDSGYQAPDSAHGLWVQDAEGGEMEPTPTARGTKRQLCCGAHGIVTKITRAELPLAPSSNYTDPQDYQQ